MKFSGIKAALMVFCIFLLTAVALPSHASDPFFPTYSRDELKKLIFKLNAKDFGSRFNFSNIESYLDTLLQLQENGIGISPSLIDGFTIEKANSSTFVENMIKLQKNGIDARAPLQYLDVAQGINERFIGTVMELCKNDRGDNIGWTSLAKYLTAEKIASSRYIGNICRLRESFSDLRTDDLIEAVGLEAGEKDWLIDTYIELKKAEVNFDFVSLRWFFKTDKSKKFFEDLKENFLFLKEKGIDFKEMMIWSSESLEKIADKNFIKGISYLKEKGLPIATDLIWSFSREKMRHKKYLDAVVLLYQNGVFSFRKKDGYRNLDSVNYEQIYYLDMEKAVDDQCIASIIKFRKAGVTATSLLDAEKLKSDQFLETIIRIENNLKKRGYNDISLNTLASDLSIEMAKNEEFISIFLENGGYVWQSAKMYAVRKPDQELLKELFSYEEKDYSWGKAWTEMFPLKMELFNKTVFLMRQEKDPIAFSVIENKLKRLLEKQVVKMNDLHERPDSERLKVIEGALPETLYYMIAFTDDLYTSTLNLISQKLKEEMKKRDTDLLGLVEKADPECRWFTKFIYQLAQYDRLAYVMEGMGENGSRKILSMFIRQLEKSKNTLEHAFYLGAATGAVLREENKNENLSRILADELFFWKENFWEKGRKKEATLLEIIISLYADYFEEEYRQTAEDLREVFKVSSGETLDLNKLADKTGVLHSVMIFYKDKDGMASFSNFLNQRRKTKWEIEDKGTFMILKKSSPNPENPVKEIRIYAKKPIENEKKQISLWDYLGENNIEPKVIVHRGHSYHTAWTLNGVDNRTEMVFLGSCGGFKETEEILKKNINMLIFCTANMGTMAVNDPLLDHIDQELLEGKTSLPDIWKTATEKIKDSRKNGYIPPHKNIGQKIYKAYKNYLDKNYLETD